MNTKIIASVGPACWDEKNLQGIIAAGADILRFNFSHASPESFISGYKLAKKIAKSLGKKVEIMMDLQGPRIRIGQLAHEINLVEGETYCFSHLLNDVDNLEIPLDNSELCKDIKAGEPFYLANGAMELRVTKVSNDKIFAKVERGGLLLSKKGINIPKTSLSSGGLTKKDITDALLGLEHKVDYIAMSFVQNAGDIKKLKEVLLKKKPSKLPLIIAKIERAVALDNIDEIIRESDVVMIARGDLGIEIPLEDLPIVQKNIIRHAHWHDKPAIVATQMLVSMMEHARPTRAEVSDVANAIFDGTDSVMLSDETAAGKYPVLTVKTMKKIIDRTNYYFNNRNYFDPKLPIYKK